jgi:alpha/beta superfamily hydrolase
MQTVTFRVGDLTLEGILHSAENAQSVPVPGAVVCHPHPVYGGDMDNAVIATVCDALSRHGIAALRFNFRGTGGSQGTHGGGREERNDARAALDFLASQAGFDPQRLCLAGYSFGAVVALSTPYPSLAALAAISPPLTPARGRGIQLACPTLLVFGERDRVAPAASLQRAGIDLPPGSRVAVIAGADHFWWGHEEEAAKEVVAFFSEHTRPQPGAPTRDAAPR